MPCNWLPDMPKMLLLTHVRGLEMSNQFMLSDDILDALLESYAPITVIGCMAMI